MNDHAVAPDLTAALVPEPEGIIPLSQFVADFGESTLSGMLPDNVHEFLTVSPGAKRVVRSTPEGAAPGTVQHSLMDDKGDPVFPDRVATVTCNREARSPGR